MAPTPATDTTLSHELAATGYAWVRHALGSEHLTQLTALLHHDRPEGGARARRGETYAIRNLLWQREGVAAALTAVGLDAIATDALGGAAFPINAIYFDKTPEANWKVPSHQDILMPVEERHECAGFTNWSDKLGVTYVAPPESVLASLVALRVLLDPCPESNGPLCVLPGSHLRGILATSEIAACAPSEFAACVGEAGDVLLMKPLLVHRSSPATNPQNRRVLHVVYAAAAPGGGVRWRQPSHGVATDLSSRTPMTAPID